MKYRSFSGFVFVLSVGVEVGAVVSYYFTQTLYPIIIIGVLALTSGVIWLFWSKIASPFLRAILAGLEISISEIVTDAKYNQTKVLFNIVNSQQREVSLKGFTNSTIKLDTERVSEILILKEPVKLKRPSVKIDVTFNLPPRYIEHIRGKQSNDKEHWQIETSCLIDTRWGEIVWKPVIENFEQSPRLGNIP